jgi:hypothetical protein
VTVFDPFTKRQLTLDEIRRLLDDALRTKDYVKADHYAVLQVREIASQVKHPAPPVHR